MRIPFFQKKKFFEEDSFLTAALIVCSVLAVILGYFVWREYGFDMPYKQSGQSSEFGAGQIDDRARGLMNIPQDQRDLFSFPPADAPVEDRRAHGEKIHAAAIESTALAIEGCVGSPLVLVAEEGARITVTNKDSIEHDLFIGPDPVLSIEPNKSAILEYTFSNGKGTYVYGCDGNASGIFIVS